MEEVEKKEEGVVIEPAVELDPIKEKDEEIARLIEERDNYKTVALKRLGKLPADNTFLNGNGEEVESIIEEKVKSILLDKELNRIQAEKDAQIKQIIKENNELRIALKNRPTSGVGGGGEGGGIEVKDNVFSSDQILQLRKKAEMLKADPEKFIEKARQNFLSRR